MGSFYTNVVVKNADVDAAVAIMRALNRDSFVLEAGSDVVIYDREGDEMDGEILAALAEHLATELDTLAFTFMNIDDDILWFQLYNRAELVAEYANQEGPAVSVRAIMDTLGIERRYLAVWLTLRLPFLFQVLRHARLAKQFDLPETCVGLGYRYVERGDLGDIVPKEKLHRIEHSGYTSMRPKPIKWDGCDYQDD